jgi:hypothetical protein
MSDFQFTNYSDGSNMNDSVSSMINNTTSVYDVYQDNNYGSLSSFIGGPGGRIADMTHDIAVYFGGAQVNPSANFNDQISSIKRR